MNLPEVTSTDGGAEDERTLDDNLNTMNSFRDRSGDNDLYEEDQRCMYPA